MGISDCNLEDTIVAISTPVGTSGIGIVRLSGKRSLSIADRIFISRDGKRPSSFRTYTTRYGFIVRSLTSRSRRKKKGKSNHRCFANLDLVDALQGRYEIIDEVLLTVMKAPKSYTKEDIVEINCHGGCVCLKEVLELVLENGARLAGPGEFTKRAFLNGRIDLVQAEAVLDLISSKTERSMKLAMGQLEGELSYKIRSIRDRLLDILSEVEADMDFASEDIEVVDRGTLQKEVEDVSAEIGILLKDYHQGRIFKEGIMCVICGRPNVGKSSLMNTLLKKNRVIVTPIPGTTRDAVEEELNINGIPVRLVDTAGIKVTNNIVERHGISKSNAYIDTADLILFMVDLSRRWSKIDGEIYNRIRNRQFIIIANKSDLERKMNLEKVKKLTGFESIIEISLATKCNLNELERAIYNKIWEGRMPQGEANFVINERHKKIMDKAYKIINKAIRYIKTLTLPELVASELRCALVLINEVLGEGIAPDVLDRIFAKFCIGK